MVASSLHCGCLTVSRLISVVTAGKVVHMVQNNIPWVSINTINRLEVKDGVLHPRTTQKHSAILSYQCAIS